MLRAVALGAGLGAAAFCAWVWTEIRFTGSMTVRFTEALRWVEDWLEPIILVGAIALILVAIWREK